MSQFLPSSIQLEADYAHGKTASHSKGSKISKQVARLVLAACFIPRRRVMRLISRFCPCGG